TDKFNSKSDPPVAPGSPLAPQDWKGTRAFALRFGAVRAPLPLPPSLLGTVINTSTQTPEKTTTPLLQDGWRHRRVQQNVRQDGHAFMRRRPANESTTTSAVHINVCI
ncbi:unnamed protein product, partial [Musa acuminata var. zebrina]